MHLGVWGWCHCPRVVLSDMARYLLTLTEDPSITGIQVPHTVELKHSLYHDTLTIPLAVADGVGGVVVVSVMIGSGPGAGVLPSVH